MLSVNRRDRLVYTWSFPYQRSLLSAFSCSKSSNHKGGGAGPGGCLETQTSPTTPTLLITAEATGSPVPPHPSEEAKGESSTVEALWELLFQSSQNLQTASRALCSPELPNKTHISRACIVPLSKWTVGYIAFNIFLLSHSS